MMQIHIKDTLQQQLLLIELIMLLSGFVISMVTGIVSLIPIALSHWSVSLSFLFKSMRASYQNDRDDPGNHRYDKAS